MNWKNANRQKPESGKLVMIYTPEKTVLSSNVLMGIYWDDTGDWTVYDFESTHDRIVTHWKEVPKPPL